MSETKHTYFWIDPSSHPPLDKQIRYTRGRFVKMTKPMGLLKVPYALFQNRRSQVYIPEYDLTPETKAAIALAEREPDMTQIDFRLTIRKALDARKMSVPKLAAQVGCGQVAIYNFLAGRTEMKADLLGKILTALEFKIAKNLPKQG